MFAQLLEALLAADERIEVIGRARNGQEGVALARRFAPEVIVMDIGMPVMDGIEATRRIRSSNPAIGVVIFTGSDEARDVERAREVGAAAYVQKSHIDAVLLAAIHRAAASQRTSVNERNGPRAHRRSGDRACLTDHPWLRGRVGLCSSGGVGSRAWCLSNIGRFRQVGWAVVDAEVERRRRVNENRVKLFGGDAERAIAFLCERRAIGCRDTVVLSGAEYEVRSGRGHSVVHPRHLVLGDAPG